jgi:hypothetical protein
MRSAVATAIAALVLAGSALTNAQSPSTVCTTTTPNRHVQPSGRAPFSKSWHGNELVGTILWADGTVVFRPGGSGYVLEDGSLKMKFFWEKARKPMTISGRRLDGDPVPLRSIIAPGHDGDDFQPSSLIFATPGCWEVTARINDTDMTFVTRVVKIGAGPSNKGGR